MKGKKIIAALLAGTFAFSMAGCNKITSVNIDDFEDAWEDEGADEMSFDELYELDADSLKRQLDDGFYYRFEPRDIQYSDMIFPMLKLYHLDFNLDMDDIDEICTGLKVDTNLFDLDMADISELEDLTLDGAAGIQITLADPVDVDELADGIEDMLDVIDVEIEDLSSSEYYKTKNGLSLILRVSWQDICQGLLDAGLIDLASERAADDDQTDAFEHVLENTEGDILLYIVAQDENIVILAGLSVNGSVDILSTFTGVFGFTDPEDVTPNTAVAGAIADSFMDRMAGTMAMLESLDDPRISNDW